MIATSVELRASTQTARRATDPFPSAATTSGSSSTSAEPQRTTSTAAPFATRPALNAAAKVAMPQAVGGNVDNIPNVRTVDASSTSAELEVSDWDTGGLRASAGRSRGACERRQT